MTKKTTKKNVLKRFFILLGLLSVSPIVITIGFKALKIYTENPEKYIAYFLVALGVFLILFSVYYGFKTIKTFLDALFDAEK
ncbi:DUF6095 family protein [Tenacibaculum piscium]|uniref:Uncharacterized protein n=2 Tax=Tenacibaculum piscium TaxID=1458515 RepID=A0A2H1YHR8_9FLAO|nr:DUF6095 family protein [Tenacibaculum piscium]MBE7629998.1 hypothetical protein [Tenacibaculum piscium]SOS74980.1 conserved hypothetical protein [Tenacibaculum piscium]